MTNIIQFPGSNQSKKFISRDVQEALNKLDSETRVRLEDIIQSTAERYDFVCKPVTLELPADITADQKSAIESVIKKQQSTIAKLINELIEQKIRHEIVSPKGS